MEHSKADKPVLTALDILQFRNLQKTIIATTQPAGTIPVVLRSGNRRF